MGGAALLQRGGRRCRPPRAVDAGAAAPGRSGGSLRGAAQGARGAALETTLPGSGVDRANGVGLAPRAPAWVRRHMTRAGAQAIVNPLLSVVMPAYNELDTIDEIVRRVLAVPLRIELIVVDDCSTDGTRDLLQALQRELGFKRSEEHTSELQSQS